MSKTKQAKRKLQNSDLIKRFKQNAKRDKSRSLEFARAEMYFSAASAHAQSLIWEEAARIAQEFI